MFVDTHCHLDMGTFVSDLPDVLSRARSCGTTAMVCPSTEWETWDRQADILDEYPQLYGICGVHPHWAKDWQPEVEKRLREMLAHPKMLAVGEIGLDYFYDFSPRDVQANVFKQQLALARELDMPFVIHLRDARDDLMAVLREHHDSGSKGACPGLVHCFSEDLETARQLIDWGFHLSFTGNITYNRNVDLREILAELPHDRVLIETDAPYMTPEPWRGFRAEPGLVYRVAEEFAACWGITVAEVGRVTWQNAQRFYRLPVEPPSPEVAVANKAKAQQCWFINLPAASTWSDGAYDLAFTPFAEAHPQRNYGEAFEIGWRDAFDRWLRSTPEREVEGASITLGSHGEPLLQAELVGWAAAQLRAKGAELTLQTTGYRPTDSLRSALRQVGEHFNSVEVLLNATTPTQYQNHNKVEDSTAFEQASAFAQEAVRIGKLTRLIMRKEPKIKRSSAEKLAEKLGAEVVFVGGELRKMD